MVTHVDITPGADHVRAAEKLLRAETLASTADPGCTRFQALSPIDRVNHFTLVCVRKDGAALDNHESSAHTRAFRAEMRRSGAGRNQLTVVNGGERAG